MPVAGVKGSGSLGSLPFREIRVNPGTSVSSDYAEPGWSGNGSTVLRRRGSDVWLRRLNNRLNGDLVARNRREGIPGGWFAGEVGDRKASGTPYRQGALRAV